jgi:alkylated DNA repair dioxygenase AlkB
MFAVEQGFITEEEATAIKAVEVREYGFRAGTLKRAPKAGFYRNDKVTYSWGQHTSEHEREEKFPSWMEEIAARVEEKYGEPVNHAIVIKYSDGYENHAPWHQDKSEDVTSKNNCMKRGHGFYVISVGVPRTFQMGKALVEKPKKEEDYEVVFSEKLAHRSILPVTAEQNAAYYHCVPKEDSEGERWSLIFRTIKTTERRSTKRKASPIKSVSPTCGTHTKPMTKSELRGIFANELLSRESVWKKASKGQISELKKAAARVI